MTSIELRHIGKRFDSTLALEDVNLRIAPGELLFLLGPSGCGKSTLLRIVAGLLEPGGGSILFDGSDVTGLGTQQRNAVMCFQNYALWPHMTVRQNVEFGLSVRGGEADERSARVDQALRLVQLEAYAQRKPNALSGGQQQRATLVNNGTVTASGTGTTRSLAGTTTNNGTLSATNDGFLYVSSSNFTDNGNLLVSSGGTLYFQHGLTLGDGTLGGSGLIWANPIVVSNDPTQLVFNIGGTTQGVTYDSLTMHGNVTLGGDLDVALTNGFRTSITPSEQFIVMSLVPGYGYTMSGSFLNVVNGQRLNTTDGSGSFLVDYGTGAYATEIVLTDFQANVPEPASLILLAIAIPTLLTRQRRNRERSCQIT